MDKYLATMHVVTRLQRSLLLYLAPRSTRTNVTAFEISKHNNNNNNMYIKKYLLKI